MPKLNRYRVVREHYGDKAYAEGDEATSKLAEQWGEGFARTSKFMTADVFNTVHSESQMLRYQRKLSDMDYALDRGMIPLGSCTMKLNSATEMEAITWPAFANIHPFAPANQSQGWRELIGEMAPGLQIPAVFVVHKPHGRNLTHLFGLRGFGPVGDAKPRLVRKRVADHLEKGRAVFNHRGQNHPHAL